MNFWLKDKPKADVPVTINFVDGTTVLRTLTSIATLRDDELNEKGEEVDEEDKAVAAAGVPSVIQMPFQKKD